MKFKQKIATTFGWSDFFIAKYRCYEKTNFIAIIFVEKLLMHGISNKYSLKKEICEYVKKQRLDRQTDCAWD